MVKDTRISVRITGELKDRLERLAKTDRRTLASYVELVLEEHIMAKRKRERGK